MASFRLNLARIRNCPPPASLAELLGKFGLPETEEFGVLNHSQTDTTVVATIIRKSQQAVQRLDAETGELTSAVVEKAAAYPFCVRPAREVLEIYAGSASAIEQVGAFLASCLSLPTITEPIELDIHAALEKLSKATQRFQLRSVRVSDYAHNAYMAGPYAPKFLDSEHGKDFLQEYAEQVTAASVKFAGPTGKATVNLSPKACFSYSCNEDDQPAILSILRKLL